MLYRMLGIGYFVIGVLQWFITIYALEYWFDISIFLAVIFSGIIALGY